MNQFNSVGKNMKALIRTTSFIFICLLTTTAKAQVHATVQNGDWSASSTWQEDNVILAEVSHGTTINTRHDVYGDSDNSGQGAEVKITTANAYSITMDPCTDPANLDTDGDNISDICDLDDDNDGILDDNELNCSSGSVALSQTFASTSNPGTVPNLFPFDGADVRFDFELQGSAVWASGVSNQNNGSILPDGEYVNTQPKNTDFQNGDVGIYTYTFSEPVYNVRFKFGGMDNQDRADFEADNDGQDVPVKLSDINLGNNLTINGQSAISSAGGANAPSNSIAVEIDGPLKVIRIRVGKNNGNSGNVTLQFYELEYCLPLDSDNDGVSDHLDLDSDNDGIHDVVEAGVLNGTTIVDANNDGVIDNADTGSGTNGFFDAAETSADSGTANYTLISTDSDGTPDFQDTDSDDDGCSDANEAYADANADAGDGEQYGTGTPATTNSNGTVQSATYNTGSVLAVTDAGDATACIDSCDAVASGNLDTDNDGISDSCDLDDDNDGILDADECPIASSGQVGPYSSGDVSFTITGIPNDFNAEHLLQSVTIMGETYNDFIAPDAYMTTIPTPSSSEKIYVINNDAIPFDYNTSPSTWTTDVLPAFQSRNLNYFQGIDGSVDNNYYYELHYNTPIRVTDGIYALFAERHMNNTFELEALDYAGIPLGAKKSYNTADYIGTGVQVSRSNLTTGEEMGVMVLPSEEIAPVGSEIYAVRIYTAHNGADEGDGKFFFFGNESLMDCPDTDGDNLVDHLDLDSDNDGIHDVVEAGVLNGTTIVDANNDGIIDNANTNSGTNGFFDAAETSADSGTPNYTLISTDTDGTPDFQDTDSDDDGCSDANEAYTDANADAGDGEQYGTGTPATTNSNGTVQSATYNTGSVSAVTDAGDATACIDPCDAVASGNLDTDNDGISDSCDLDDDNDGILDEDECSDVQDLNNWSFLTGTGNSNAFDEGDFLISDNTYTINGVTYDVICEIIEINAGTFRLANGRFNLSTIAANQDLFMTYRITIVQDGSATEATPNGIPVTLENVSITLGDIDSQEGLNFTDLGGYSLNNPTPNHIIVGDELSKLGFDNGGMPNEPFNLFHPPTISGSYTTVANKPIDDLDYSIRIIYDQFSTGVFIHGATAKQPVGNRGAVFKMQVLSCDADEDGSPNHLDLDSDNDGIHDVVEAGVLNGTTIVDANNDGVIDNADTDSGTNGFFNTAETSTDSGTTNYTLISTDSDGTPDFQDTDSDNDGCSDANEAYADKNADGGDGEQYGTGTPAATNPDGTVTAAAYNTGEIAAVTDANKSVCNTTAAENDINQVPFNMAVEGSVLTNDTDGEGDNQTIQSATYLNGSGIETNLPLGTATGIYDELGLLAGTITLNTNGSYTFGANKNYTGDIPVFYVVVDDNESPTIDAATLTIEVLPNATTDGSNNAVIAQDDTNTVEQGETVTSVVTANDSDPDGDDSITLTGATASDGVGGTVTLTNTPQNIYDENNILAGQASLDGNGNIIFTADANYEGNVTVDYTITDGTDTDATILVITVEPIDATDNDTYANDDANTGLQGETLAGGILVNDYDPENDLQTVTTAMSSDGTTIVPGAASPTILEGIGTLEIGTDGSYIFIPKPSFKGTEFVGYTVCDDNSPMACEMATLYLTILPTNSTIAENDINQTPLNTTVDGNVFTNDRDEEGNKQTVQSGTYLNSAGVETSLPLATVTDIYDTNGMLAGSITLSTIGIYTFIPETDYTGEVPVGYTLVDSNGNPARDSAILTIQVLPYPTTNEDNNAVIAQDDTNTVEEGETVTSKVISNDSDPDGDAIMLTGATASNGIGGTVTLTNVPQDIYNTDNVLVGQASLDVNGDIIFTADANYEGNVLIDYTITDGVDTDTAVLTIMVTPFKAADNDSYANDDANTGMQGETLTGNILANDYDPENDTQLVTDMVSSDDTSITPDAASPTILPGIGTLEITADGDYTFIPEPNFTGTEVVVYEVCDNNNPVACETATLYLTVLLTNSTFAENDINQTPLNIAVGGDVLTNDTDKEGDEQTVQSATYLNATGMVTNLPLATATNIYDGNGTLAGSVVLDANGGYTFLPVTDYVGTVPMTYTVIDNNDNPATDPATLTIEVLPYTTTDGSNNGVVAQDDTNTTEQGTTITNVITANDSDVDGDVITVTTATASDGVGGTVTLTESPQDIFDANNVLAGQAILDGSGNVVFTADMNYAGSVAIGYMVTDGTDTDRAVLTITVVPVDAVGNETYVNDHADIGLQNEILIGNLLVNGNDPENNLQEVSGAVSSDGTVISGIGSETNVATNLTGVGSVKIEADGTYTFIPEPDFVGTEYVKYTVCDDGNPEACETATLYLTVLATNSTIAENDINQTPLNTDVGGNVLTNDMDEEDDIQTIASATYLNAAGIMTNLPLTTATDVYDETGVLAGSIELYTDGSYDFSPATDYTGTVPLVYVVKDNNENLATDTASLTIEILSNSLGQVANNGVVAQDDTNTIEQGATIKTLIFANDSDPDGDAIYVTEITALDEFGAVIELNGTAQNIYDADGILAGQAIFDGVNNVIFTAVTDYEGEVPVNYEISDGADTDDAVLTITVVPFDSRDNRVYANDDANTGLQGVTLSGDILSNDYDPEGDVLGVTTAAGSDGTEVIPGAASPTLLSGIGTLEIATDGTYSFIPEPDFNGTELVVYEVCDNKNPVACEMATLYLTVLPTNSTFAENDINQTPLNIVIGGDVLTNDTDDEGDGQMVVSATYLNSVGMVTELPLATDTDIYDDNGTLAGSVILNTDGDYTFSPAMDYVGTVPMTYTITDDNNNPTIDSATLTIEVLPYTTTDGANNNVVAQDDTNTVEQGNTVTSVITSNDSDPDGDIITVMEVTASDGAGGTIILTTTPQNIYDINNVFAGQASLDINSSVVFTANADYEGEVSMGYVITDGIDTDDAVLTIRVESFEEDNDTYANDDANIGLQWESLQGNLLDNDNDPENNLQEISSAVTSDGTIISGLTGESNVATALPGIGLVKIEANGNYIFIPEPDFVGTEYIEYTVCDDGNPEACETATLYLTVLATNSTVAENDINQTPMNTEVDGDILTNDTDDQNDNQTVQSVTCLNSVGEVTELPLGIATDIYDEIGTLAGSMELNANGSYNFSPATDYTGTVPLEYVVTDDNENPAIDSASLTIEVLSNSVGQVANNGVVAQDDTNTVEQGATIKTLIFANDSDPDGDAIYITGITALDESGDAITLDATAQNIYDADGTLAGQAIFDGVNNVIFTAAMDYEGEAPVYYEISDGTDTDDAVLTITVVPSDSRVNNVYANDDANTGLQGVLLSGDILSNDYDPNGDLIVVTTFMGSDGNAVMPNAGSPTTLQGVGTLEMTADGTYHFIPESNFVGTEVVTYEVCDNGNPVACEMATLYLTVLPTNFTVAENDISQTPQNASVAGNMLTNDTDEEGDAQTVQSATYLNSAGMATNLPLATATNIYDETGILAGSMTLNEEGDYTFVPVAGYTGLVPVNYVAVDDNNYPATDAAILTIEVLPNSVTDGGNNSVIAQDDTNTVEQGSTVTSVVTANDSDPDGDAITVTEATAFDETGGIITLTNTAQNIYDTDGVLAGQASLDTNGNIIFTADADYLGSVPIEYTATDGEDTDVAVLTIVVELSDATDNDTHANDDANTGLQGAVITGAVLLNDYDPEGDTQLVTTVTSSNGTAIVPGATAPTTLTGIGTLEMDANGNYVFNPEPNFTGTEVIVYEVCDDANPVACETATLYLTVLPTNSTSTTDDYNNTSFNTPVGGDASVNDTDQEGDIQTFALQGLNGGMNALDGTIVMNPNGSYMFTPAPDFAGETSFQYEACDDGTPQACDIATIYIEVLPSVSPEGQPIIANPDANTIEMGQTTMGNVLSNDLDPDGGMLTVTSTVTNEMVSGIDTEGNVVNNAGILTINANGSYTFVPVPNFTGTVDNYPYTVCNDETIPDCDNTVLLIDVVPDNGNSTFANDDATITDAGISIAGDLSENDFDLEGDKQTISSYLFDSDGDGISDSLGNVNGVTTIGGTNENGTFVSNAGTLELNDDGTYVFTPATGFLGNLNVSYTICDDNAIQACDNAVLVMTVLDANRDYGDSPGGYPIVWHRAISDTNGDRILDGSTNVWLGTGTDFESFQPESEGADTDEYDDAISFGGADGQFPKTANQGQVYNVNVILNGEMPGDEVYYGMWIDWNNDGIYEDFYNGFGVVNGPVNVTVSITAPSTILETEPINVRLRADDDPFTMADSGGARTNGEVEDYLSTTELPVELIYLEGHAKECTNELRWATATEENNSYFLLEYSEDGDHFIPLGRIEGNGNSSETIEYSYTHKDVTNAYSYYRLMQVDFDGTHEYSDVVVIVTDCIGVSLKGTRVYPNPTSGRVRVEIVSDTETEKNLDLVVTDVLGRVILEKNMSVQQGMNREDLDLDSFASGIYILSIKNEGVVVESHSINLSND